MTKKPQIKTEYVSIINGQTPKIPILLNALKAFVVGGTLCLLGELLKNFLMIQGMEEELAVSAYLLILIALTAFLTGIGIYDKAGQFAGAGLGVPISGFANSVSSAMIEYHSEGLVLGTASNAFKLAGAVIVCGSVSAFLLTMLDWLLEVF